MSSIGSNRVDIVIRNGTIVDGTGAKKYQGNLAIDQGSIVAVGQLQHIEADTIIDAKNCVVAPGFIDVHVHSERELVGGRDRWAGIQQGVTTQLLAPDGFSWAHLHGPVREEMRQYLQVFYGETPTEWGGASVQQYISLFENRLPSHIALQAPHGAIRAAVMGWSTAAADERQLEQMKGLVKEWMDAGAVAFCTGLEYEPTVHADLRELVELSKVTAAYGGVYVAHQRGRIEGKLHGTEETLEIAKQAGIAVHISHFTVDDDRALSLKQGEIDGVDLSFDMYPYPAGCTHLLYYLPAWAQAGSPAEVKERLANDSDRARMAEHLNNAFPPERLQLASIQSIHYERYVGMTLADIVLSCNKSLSELICDMLLSSDLQALFIYHWDPARMPFLERTLRHPRHMVSTDGIFVGGSPHPRGYGTYPHILGSLVREKGWLTIEEAVRKMSGFPAERFKLPQRGLIAPGYAADIVIFDPNTIGSNATFTHPRVMPTGIKDVLVEGCFVLKDGEITGQLPGRVLMKQAER